MSKLYEITGQIKEIEDLIEEGELDAEVIADTLKGIELEWNQKVDDICSMLKNLAGLADAIDREAQNLKFRSNALRNRMDSIKQYLEREFQALNKEKFETARNKIYFRTSSSVNVEDITEFVQWCYDNGETCYLTMHPTVDKAMVREAIEAGVEVPGCSIVNKRNIQFK